MFFGQFCSVPAPGCCEHQSHPHAALGCGVCSTALRQGEPEGCLAEHWAPASASLGFSRGDKAPPEPKAGPWLCREGNLAELPCSSGRSAPLAEGAALSLACSPPVAALQAMRLSVPEETPPQLLGPSSAAFSHLPFPGVLSSVSKGTFCALLSHTAFDVGAVMEIMFVLFSETTLPLTHVGFFSPVCYLNA